MRATTACWAALLVGLVSCAALNKSTFSDSQDNCLRNAGQCEQDCARWFVATEPPSNDYECESLALAQSAAALNGQTRAVTPAWVRFHLVAMNNLCRDGIASGCSMRDSLQSLLDGMVAASDARTKSIRAKLAEAEGLLDSLHLPHVEGFQEEFFNAEKALKNNDLDAADQQADVVLQEVKKVAAAREQAAADHERGEYLAAAIAQKEAQERAQAPAIEAATAACNANPVACKAKCEGGDGPTCFAWATRLWKKTTPLKLADARAAMQKACDAGTTVACTDVLTVDADVHAATANAQAAADKLDELWGDVATAGDEIAGNTYRASFARSMEPLMPPAHRLQNERAIQRMMAYTSTVVRDKYCAAKKAFVAQGAAEFSKRAAAHCKDGPPVGDGRDGIQVKLTSQCQSAFATACP